MNTVFERVGDDARIVRLDELLMPRPQRSAPSTASAQSSTLESKPAPATDPRVALEAERRAVLDAAREEGLAAGLHEAEQRIEMRARAAECSARHIHDREAERLADVCTRLESLLAALPKEIAALEQRSEAIVVEAVFAATVRLVGELARDDARLVDYCRAALVAHSARPAVLRVHPDALAAVRDALPDAAKETLRVEGDAALGPMHCLIESERGIYDVSLEHRLEVLKRVLLESLAGDLERTRG